MLKNINTEELKKKLKINKGTIVSGVFGVIIGSTIGVSVMGGLLKNNNNDNVDNKVQTEISTELETEEKITELDVELFNEKVEEIDAIYKAAGLNLRKEYLELVVYINNIDIATPELMEKIESCYNGKEDIMNTYLKVITSINNHNNDYYNGKVDNYVNVSDTCLDEIDNETMSYFENLFHELYNVTSKQSSIELSMEKLNQMVENVMNKNKELGLDFDEQDIKIYIYDQNKEYATDEVKNYVSSLKLAEDDTFEKIDSRVLGNYKHYNKTADNQFDLSNFNLESCYAEVVVSKIEDFMLKNGTINGVTKDQVSTGAFFTLKVMIDDSLAYFATTTYINNCEVRVNTIVDANMGSAISRLYSTMGSKTVQPSCETEEKTK